MKKYFVNDRQYSREEFNCMLQDAVHGEALEELPQYATTNDVNEAYERMLRVAKGLLEERYEVYVSDIYFRVAEEN